jgi:hypothetical protein
MQGIVIRQLLCAGLCADIRASRFTSVSYIPVHTIKKWVTLRGRRVWPFLRPLSENALAVQLECQNYLAHHRFPGADDMLCGVRDRMLLRQIQER